MKIDLNLFPMEDGHASEKQSVDSVEVQIVRLEGTSDILCSKEEPDTRSLGCEGFPSPALKNSTSIQFVASSKMSLLETPSERADVSPCLPMAVFFEKKMPVSS